MNISIRALTRDPEMWMDAPHCQGEITIGNYKEGFMIPLIYWTIADYEKQWKEGLERIKTHNTSCLVTRIGDPKYGLYAMFWPLFKIGKKIYVTERLLIPKLLDELIKYNKIPQKLKSIEFNNKTCYQFVAPRYNSENDDLPGDEWSVNLDNWN